MNFFQIWIASSAGHAFCVPLSDNQVKQVLADIAEIKGRFDALDQVMKDFSNNESVSQATKINPKKFLITLARGLAPEMISTEISNRLGKDYSKYKICGASSNINTIHYHVLGF